MMSYIAIPVIVGIITFGVYSLFELFVRKKERLTIIEKLSDKFGPEMLNGKLDLNLFKRNSFSALKASGLLIGVGLGLLVGFFIADYYFDLASGTRVSGQREMLATIYGASVFLFAGLGLLVAFILEQKMNKGNK